MLSDLRRALYRLATELKHKEVLKETRWLEEPGVPGRGEGRKAELAESLALNEPLATASDLLICEQSSFRGVSFIRQRG